MMFEIIYNDYGKPIRIQEQQPYKFNDLKVGMTVYYTKFKRNLKIINIYDDCKRIYFENLYGYVKYEENCFYPI
jgi:hypothetical protein